MNEAISQEAELRLKVIVDGAEQLHALSDGNRDVERLATTLLKTTDRFQKMSSAARDARMAANQTTQGWASAWSPAISAQHQLEDSVKSATDGIISQRYALYDVATTYGIIGAGLLSVGGMALKAGTDFESSFANVIRTSDDSAASLSKVHDQLVDMSTQIPKSFSDLSSIATLGNQLGVASKDITEFTEVVAKFSVVANLTPEAAATAFGKLSNLMHLPISEANNLGSAIEKVGINSASTDAEIISIAQRLANTATQAGFTSDQIIGLSGALGSLGQAPERSQGVFEKYFTTINEAIAEGGDKLKAFSAITGLTADELNRMVRSGQGFDVFTKFLDGLKGADPVQLTASLDALGLSGLRSNQVITSITSNLPLLRQAFDDAAQGAAQGTELNRQYDIIAQTLAARLQTLGQAVQAFAASGVANMVPGLADAVGALTDLVNGARAFVGTDIGGFVARSVLTITALAGAFFVYRSITALATASTLALVTAQKQIGASGAAGGVSGLIAALRLLKLTQDEATISAARLAASTRAVGSEAVVAGAASKGAATEITFMQAASDRAAIAGYRLADGLLALGRATIVLGALQLVLSLLFDFNNTVATGAELLKPLDHGLEQIADAAAGAFWGISNFLTGIQSMISGAGQALGPLSFLADAVANVFGGAATFAGQNWMAATDIAAGARAGQKNLTDFAATMRGTSVDASKTQGALGKTNDALDALTAGFGKGTGAAADFADGLGGGGGGDGVGGAADQATQKIRTLVDYANDLSSVFKRAFDIRFGPSQGLDAITAGWSAIKKATEESNRAIADYHAQLLGLSSDKEVTQFWLTIAEGYGDTIRANKLRADLAETNSKIEKTQADLSKEQDKNSKTLDGNSDAAIANRATILGLVGSYSDYITKLASSGVSQEELQSTSARLKQEFIAQATQMGFSRAQVEKYAKAFDDLSTIIRNVPRNVTITANVDPALQALNEFNAALASTRANAGKGIAIGAVTNPTNAAEVRRAALEARIAAYAAYMKQLIAEGNSRGAVSVNGAIERMASDLRYGNYWTGGYVGDGGKYEPKGIVHGGEYVFSKEATSNLGVGYLGALHALAKSGKPARGSAPTVMTNGVQVVTFDARSTQLLMDIRDAAAASGFVNVPALTNALGTVNANDASRGVS